MTKPTDSELEILRVLWSNGPSSVRLVNDKINESKETGYTTTLKIMQIMAQKGLVERDETSRTHIYRAVAQKGQVQEAMVDKLLDMAFGGSSSQLVLSALGRGKTSKEELDQIKELIKKLEDGDQ
ncbi:BlaI/MecI/CopY family transcriptional regulator [Roseivirga sp. E12]|uniref:BlaI/MecI/CopY family transcriptional regulator n=1 Tax=Roseivirga sp. E12 TaxID=2819237 RepID=UPI001ABC3AC4|nr:BlaI/MecI/CopY family transcriptional regulator [Roseivirga sp. E12]MBO3698807.1 BlaI/MecI/CopY family transcriptional regulator [Roseivirga sp. E12]